MKKHILLLGIAVVMATFGMVARAENSEDLNSAIKMYKAGNYTGCIQTLDRLLQDDSGNAVAHYYMAMANAQAGNVDEAISHYDTVINLSSQKVLVRYSQKGKLCLQSPDKCHLVDTLDGFIKAKKGFDLTNKVKHSVETQNLDEMRREINSNKIIEPERFKEFRNFSTMNSQSPSNDEIVAALKTLQQAGLDSFVAPQSYNNMQNMFASTLSGNSQTGMDGIMQLMGRMGNSTGVDKNIDARILQSMMSSQIMGF